MLNLELNKRNWKKKEEWKRETHRSEEEEEAGEEEVTTNRTERKWTHDDDAEEEAEDEEDEEGGGELEFGSGDDGVGVRLRALIYGKLTMWVQRNWNWVDIDFPSHYQKTP